MLLWLAHEMLRSDYALNLVKKRNFVTILNCGGDVKCLGLLWQRANDETAVEHHAEKPVSVIEVNVNGYPYQVKRLAIS